MIKHCLVIVLFVTLVFFLGYRFLLQVPPPWPDEAIFADIARNILAYGQQSTTLWMGMITGVERFASWYPPLFFNLLAVWFRFFGISIDSQRVLSLLIACTFMLVFYPAIFELLKQSLRKIKLAGMILLLTFGLLSIDRNFLESVRISRPETLMLFFSSLSALSTLLFLRHYRHGSIWLVICGLALGLGILTHFIFWVYVLGNGLLLWKSRKFLNREKVVWLLSPILFLIILWGIFAAPNINILVSQVFSVTSVRAINHSWLEYVFSGKDTELKLLYASYAYLLGDFIVWSWVIKNNSYRALGIFTLTLTVVAYAGKIQWYFVLPLPLIYLGGSIRVIETLFSKHTKVWWSVAVSIACLLISLWVNADRLFLEFSVLNRQTYSYQEFKAGILRQIPVGKTVFLSAIPDPYFAFLGRKNKLYEFPVIPVKPEIYRQILDDSDYILFNAHLDYNVSGDFLVRYLQRNARQIVYLNKPSQFGVYIVELKPRNQRS